MNLFTEIDALIPTMQGWCSVEKARTMALMVLALKPKICVEIGVFAGRSALPVAMALKENGSGKLIAIDAWSADAAIENETTENKEWWGKSVNYEAIKNEFYAAVEKTNTRPFVACYQSKSDDYVFNPSDMTIDFLHIDGSHTQQAERDAGRFASRIPIDGIVVMDDIDWKGDGVKNAVSKLFSMGFEELFKLGTGAVFQRVK